MTNVRRYQTNDSIAWQQYASTLLLASQQGNVQSGRPGAIGNDAISWLACTGYLRIDVKLEQYIVRYVLTEKGRALIERMK